MPRKKTREQQTRENNDALSGLRYDQENSHTGIDMENHLAHITDMLMYLTIEVAALTDLLAKKL